MLPRILHSLTFLFRWTGVFVLAILFVGIVVLFLYSAVFPRLAAHPTLSRWAFFEGATEKVTIIERNETVTVTETDYIPRLITDTQNVLVTVISQASAPSQSMIGSGFFVTNDGVLALHKDEIFESPNATYSVITMDGNEHSATLIGVDPYTEIALLRAEGVNASTLPFARISEFGSGRKVLLMQRIPGTGGAPSATLSLVEHFGYTQNLASQSLASSEKFEGLYALGSIKDDKNSSAAMSMQGELVGMVITKTRDNILYAYILPNTAIDATLQNISQDGTLRDRSILGVSYASITPELARAHALPATAGAWLALDGNARIATVLYGSPAQKAGLRSGDIITKVGDTEITPATPLSTLVSDVPEGSSIIVTVLRGEKSVEISVIF